MKIDIPNEMMQKIHDGYIPAKELVSLVMNSGFKSSNPVEETSLSDLYTLEYAVKGACIYEGYMELDLVKREFIEVESVLTENVISVMSSCTIFIQAQMVERRSLESTLERIKAMRKKCRANGVKFSSPSVNEICELWGEYIDSYSEYKGRYKKLLTFWHNAVNNGLYSGLHEIKNSPKTLEDLLYRNGSISRVESIIQRLNEVERMDIDNYSMIAI